MHLLAQKVEIIMGRAAYLDQLVFDSALMRILENGLRENGIVDRSLFPDTGKKNVCRLVFLLFVTLMRQCYQYSLDLTLGPRMTKIFYSSIFILNISDPQTSSTFISIAKVLVLLCSLRGIPLKLFPKARM